MPGLVICCNNSNNTATPERRGHATNCYLKYIFSLHNKDVVQFFIEQIFFARFLPPITQIDKRFKMKITHKEDPNGGVFYIEQNGEPAAEMVYRIEKDRMVIEHTEADESLRGQNIGFQLVERGVELARQNHLKIVPVCAFAKKILERHKELQDVL